MYPEIKIIECDFWAKVFKKAKYLDHSQMKKGAIKKKGLSKQEQDYLKFLSFVTEQQFF